MIDEELYQQAADELISDRRQPHIWARACALASDDHDEARYLYTNLRVEELIAERESGGVLPTSASDFGVDHDSTLALESESFGADDTVDTESAFINDDEFSLSDDDGDGDDISALASTAAGVDSSGSTESVDDLRLHMPTDEDHSDPLLDDTAELVDSTAVIDLDSDELAEFQATIPPEDFESYDSSAADSLEEPSQVDDELLEIEGLPSNSTSSGAEPNNGAFQQNNDQLDNLLGGIYPAEGDTSQTAYEDAEAVLTADFSDASGTQAVLLEDELDWLDDEVASDDPSQQLEPYQPESLERDHTDRLTMELERQADEMPGQHSDVIAHEEFEQPDISPAAPPVEKPENASPEFSDIDDALDTQPDNAVAAFTATAKATAAATVAGAGAAATAAVVSRSSASPDLSAPNTASITEPTSRSPQDAADQGKGKHYSVYQRNQNLQAVKDGVSWSALLATLPFMIYRHLFGTAIMYIIMAIILVAGLIMTGLIWFDTGLQATPLIKAATIGFAVLTAVGLLYMPFRYGNAWRGEKLENRGFDLIAKVPAKSPGKAIAKARREAALG